MPTKVRIRKGLNLKLKGEAQKELKTIPLPETVAIQPMDFTGVIPRLLVHEGDEVLAGTPLFQDKKHESIMFCSPVSGEVIEVVRGEKRRILEIKILADKEIRYKNFSNLDLNNPEKQTIIDRILESGAWPFIRQRPYGVIPDPAITPKNIFISAFDTNPLAPDLDFIIQDSQDDFQSGLDVLVKLTDGKVHLNIKTVSESSSVFTKATGVEVNSVSGPHPAGNVGVQIHHIAPVNKGEITWCISPQDVVVIGRLFKKGIFDTARVVAITGSQVIHPAYYNTITGCSIKNILDDAGLKEEKNRIISGNVLTGRKISSEGYLGFYDSQVTVIPEGDEPEFIGWLMPGFNKFSNSRAFFSWLSPNKEYALDTNMHGEERPFVVTGQYEEVFPMDIFPVQLLKAILVEDIDLMEKLGIYEVVEEDFALCEFVCTSKIESQKIIRHGLDIVRKELG